jgi:DNA-binding NarL/FixJ family response regulator
MTTVLLVDDQALVRVGFRLVLESNPDIEVLGEAADGRTAFEQVAALRPQVVVMDVRMPGINGIDATRNIVEAYPEVRASRRERSRCCGA